MITWKAKNKCTVPILCFTFSMYEWACSEQLHLWMFPHFSAGYKYEGVKFERGNCGVSIMRSGKWNLLKRTYRIRVFPFVSACVMSSVHYVISAVYSVLHIFIRSGWWCSGPYTSSLSVKLIDHLNTKWCNRIMLHRTLRQIQCCAIQSMLPEGIAVSGSVYFLLQI